MNKDKDKKVSAECSIPVTSLNSLMDTSARFGTGIIDDVAKPEPLRVCWTLLSDVFESVDFSGLDTGPDFSELIGELKQLQFGSVSNYNFARATYYSGREEFVTINWNVFDQVSQHSIIDSASSSRNPVENSCESPYEKLYAQKLKQISIKKECKKWQETFLQQQMEMKLESMSDICAFAREDRPSCLILAIRIADKLNATESSEVIFCDKCETLSSLARNVLNVDLLNPNSHNQIDQVIPFNFGYGSSVAQQYTARLEKQYRFSTDKFDECKFCLKIHTPEDISRSNALRVGGIISCPVLRQLIFNKSGAAEDTARTLASSHLAASDEQVEIRRQHKFNCRTKNVQAPRSPGFDRNRRGYGNEKKPVRNILENGYFKDGRNLKF